MVRLKIVRSESGEAGIATIARHHHEPAHEGPERAHAPAPALSPAQPVACQHRHERERRELGEAGERGERSWAGGELANQQRGEHEHRHQRVVSLLSSAYSVNG